MAEDSDLERTEEPTGRRLEQAREEGQVPHSRELSTFLVLVVGVSTLWATSGWMAERLRLIMQKGLTLDTAMVRDPSRMGIRLLDLGVDGLLTLAPLVIAVVIAALASPFFLNSWIFSPKAFMPNFSRLNPLSGLGRMVSWQGLVELLKAIIKSLLIGGVAAWVLWADRQEIIGLLAEPLHGGMMHAGKLILHAFLLIVSVMALVVVVDVPFQFWQYYDRLKMSKEEVKQEYKEMEGDPHVKGRIRSLQREAARKRMMAAVPTADVVVTNPTHFSVALSYKTGMKAPKLVAKGRGEVALKIRALATDSGVPLLEAPPLARAIYKHVEIDDEIPGNLYAAVAEVLAYVYQINQYRAGQGEPPVKPDKIAIPAGLDPEEGLVHG